MDVVYPTRTVMVLYHTLCNNTPVVSRGTRDDAVVLPGGSKQVWAPKFENFVFFPTRAGGDSEGKGKKIKSAARAVKASKLRQQGQGQETSWPIIRLDFKRVYDSRRRVLGKSPGWEWWRTGRGLSWDHLGRFRRLQHLLHLHKKKKNRSRCTSFCSSSRSRRIRSTLAWVKLELPQHPHLCAGKDNTECTE